jgi:hypothetical protein
MRSTTQILALWVPMVFLCCCSAIVKQKQKKPDPMLKWFENEQKEHGITPENPGKIEPFTAVPR